MNETVELSTETITERPGLAGSFPFRSLGVIVPLAGLWLLGCAGLSIHWRLNPQYHYGWFVPALALFAGWGRWSTRPAPGPAEAKGFRVAVLLAAAILPTWVFSQPNADWPVVNWLFTAEIVGLTLGLLAWAGGRPWLRHFFFPVALILTAVPWPDRLEAPLIQEMMRLVSGTAVTLLDFAGVGALQHGNLIEVATGTVGVSEACSGIRSLQGSLMASLFLGELFRFGSGRRAVLVLVSLTVAFFTNVLRAAFLAWSAARSGLESVERWHDPAGTTVLLVCVAAIFAVASLLDRKSAPRPASPGAVAAHPLPGWFLPGLAAWLVLTVAGAELWYYDAAPPPPSPWLLQPPAESTRVEIPVVAIGNLHFDRATTGAWSDHEGNRWLLYFFEWNFGPAFSRVAAALHRPDICLPAAGTELQEDRGVLSFAAGGSEVPFHGYSFRQGGGLLYVYHGLWQIRSERGRNHGALSSSKHVAAWQSVLWRDRSVGQQVAEIMVSGYTSAEQADAAFRELLPQLLVTSIPPYVSPF